MTPRGFWSYARGDDAHLDEELSRLRMRVASEIAFQLGAEIGMFQDVYDIRTGDNWEETLRAALTDASFMVPILTPRYFTRPWCREEVTTFLRLSREAGRVPLLFPILFAPDRAAAKKPDDEVRKALAPFQYFDWRKLRFEESEAVKGRAVHDFALDIVEKLDAVEETAPPPPPPPEPEPAPPPPPETTERKRVAPRVRKPAPKTDQPTLIVDLVGGGDYTSIQAAIDAAKDGTRLLIRPGVYAETLRVEIPLDIEADGDLGDVTVRTRTGSALQLTGHRGTVSRISFDHVGDGDNHALMAHNTKWRIEACSFRSERLSSAVIAGEEGAMVFGGCHFSSGDNWGLAILNEARPILEDCSISDNRSFGISVWNGARPTVRNCRITGNGDFGVQISGADSGGTFENNDLRGNKRGAWKFSDGTEANVIRKDNLED